jgi:chemotaxis signal transduction protein
VSTKRGGVIVRQGDALRFLPASVVVRITACPPISRLPGAPKPLLGITHTGGEIVPVIAIDDREHTHETPLLVCRYLGEPVGLLGCDVVETGTFEADEAVEGVVYEGAPTRSLDLVATFASLHVNVRWEG